MLILPQRAATALPFQPRRSHRRGWILFSNINHTSRFHSQEYAGEWQNRSSTPTLHCRGGRYVRSQHSNHPIGRIFRRERAFSPRAEEQYRSILIVFLSKVNVDTCTPTDVQKFLRTSGWGNSRQYVASVAIRHFIWWKFGEHPALRVRIKREKPHPGRTLTETQMIRLLKSFDRTTMKGCRDYAIACFALETG